MLIGGGGDDQLSGDEGVDVEQYTGTYADYRLTKLQDTHGATTWRVLETAGRRDVVDTRTDIETQVKRRTVSRP